MNIRVKVSDSDSQGVNSYSTIVGQTPYVIFCVGQSMVRQQQFKSWALANCIPFKAVKGMYKNVSENSFVMKQSDFEDHVQPKGWVNEEESVLILGPCNARNHRQATLLYSDGQSVPIGTFKATTPKVAAKSEAWTYDPTTGVYYICE